MLSAEEFTAALKRGSSVEAAFSTVPLFEPRHRRVYLSFARGRGEWYCRFHRTDLAKTPLTRRFTYRGSQAKEMVVRVARRGHAFTSRYLARQFRQAIARGFGGIFLNLTDSEYQALESQPWRSTPH